MKKDMYTLSHIKDEDIRKIYKALMFKAKINCDCPKSKTIKKALILGDILKKLDEYNEIK